MKLAAIHVKFYLFLCLQLMNYSEFRTMTTALEKHYRDVKIAILTGKKSEKELDMR